MKKIKTKILLGFGVTTALATTGSVVLSCGNSNSDQPKLNSVTVQMVADYVKEKDSFAPSFAKDAPTVAPSTTLIDATLNGVSGLTIAISNWVANPTLGSVTFDASISKIGLIDKDIVGVTYGGWITNDQKALDVVTAQDVIDYIKTQTGFAPSDDADVPAAAPSITLDNCTLNGLSGLTITISNWIPYYAIGSVTFGVSINKNGLETKVIIGVTYGGWYNGLIPTDQKSLNAATPKMVADYIKTQTGFIPGHNKDVPTNVPSDTIFNATLNGVGGLTIAISNWTSSYFDGSVTFDVSISKTGLKPKDISGVTYNGYIAYTTVINNDNLANSEGKLWSWDNIINALTIKEGVTSIATSDSVTKWGEHNISDAKNIIFPDSLKIIGNGAFAELSATGFGALTFPKVLESIGSNAFKSLKNVYLYFNGDIPGTPGKTRTLSIAIKAFPFLSIREIRDHDWQDWAFQNCPGAFKPN